MVELVDPYRSTTWWMLFASRKYPNLTRVEGFSCCPLIVPSTEWPDKSFAAVSGRWDGQGQLRVVSE